MSSAVAEPPTDTTPIEVPAVERLVANELTGLTREDSDKVMRRLASHCIALKVTVRGVMHECKIGDAANVTVNGQQLDDSTISRVTGLALPPSVRTRISRAADAVRSTPGRFGTRFPGGAYLIPLRSGERRPAEQAMDQIATLRAAYRQTAVECRDEFEAHMQELKDKNPPVYAKARRAVPDGNAFVAAHKVETMLFPLGRGLPSQFWGQTQSYLQDFVPQAQLEEVLTHLKHLASAPDRSAGEQEASEWARETRMAADRLVQETVTSMIGEPIQEFADALAHVERSMLSTSSVRESTIIRMREAYQKLTAFEFMLPANMLERLHRAGRRLSDLTPQAVNAESRALAVQGGASELAQFFRETRESLTSQSTVTGMVGEAFRNLDLD